MHSHHSSTTCLLTCRPDLTDSRDRPGVLSYLPRRFNSPSMTGLKASGARWPLYLCPLTNTRSEEHTSEPQSPMFLVCGLLLDKKNDYRSLKRSAARLRPGLGAASLAESA